MSNGKLTSAGVKIAESRYFWEGRDIDWEGLSNRVGRECGQHEVDRSYEEKFAEMVFNMDFLPAGRILRNAGRPRGSCFNCYVLGLGDSIEEIGQFQKDSLILWSEGGGVGTSIGHLRPKGASIKGKGGVSSGPLSFLEASDAQAKTIESGGGRRAAGLAMMPVSHPDIVDFINSKSVDKILKFYNISVGVKESFLDAVEADSEWELRFNKKLYKTVPARDIWDLIINNMVKFAEPGLLNLNNLKSNNSYYHAPIQSVNPCQPHWATVLTPLGISTIGKITTGDYIWSEDGWVKVVNKINAGKKKVYKYKTTASVFYGTKNHRIKSNGEKIEVGKAHSIDILRGDTLLKMQYPEIINQEAVMDGLVLGDGSVHKASNNLVYLYVGKKDTDYFNSEVKNLIIKHRPGLKETAYEIKTSITHKELPKTYKRQIPNRFKFSSHDTIASFLRGLYSANGSVVKSVKRISYKTASKQMSEDIQLMLSSLGIKSYITTNKSKKNKFSNGEYICKQSYDIYIGTHRDVKLFDFYVGFIQQYKNEDLKQILIGIAGNEKNTFDINEIEFISEEEVFDITVDAPSHTYWSGWLQCFKLRRSLFV